MSGTLRFARHVPALGHSQHFTAPAGATLADLAGMLGETGDVPPGLLRCYVKLSDGRWFEIQAARWAGFRPKRDDMVCFFARLGDDGNGALLTLVATIAISVLVPYAVGALLPGLTGLALTAAQGAATFGATYLLRKYFPNEPQAGSAARAQRADASRVADVSSDFNPSAKRAFLTRVFGTARINPHDLMEPWPTIENGRPAVTKLMGLEGPVGLYDPTANGALVADNPAFTVETRNGVPGTPITTFVRGFAKTVDIGATMDNFALDGRALEDQDNPLNSTPKAIRFHTDRVYGMEEVAIRAALSQFVKADGSTPIAVSFRIAYWPTGTDYADRVKIPQIDLFGAQAGSFLKDFRFRRGTDFSEDDTAVSGAITARMWRRVPAVTAWELADGTDGGWEAHEHFALGDGLRDVHNIFVTRRGIRVILNHDIFPDGDYEWEIARSIVTDADAIDDDYTISGDVVSLFQARREDTPGTPWNVPKAQTNYPVQIALQHASVISGEPAVERPGTALVAVRAEGHPIRGFSVVAKGMAHDWDGSGWNTLIETDNPALHTRQLCDDIIRESKVGPYSRFSHIRALAQSVLDDDEKVLAWKAQCEIMGAKVSYPVAGERFDEDVLPRLMAAGLAAPSIGPVIGFNFFRDRSTEQPSPVFTPRTASIRIIRENPMRPAGLRAVFRNAARDWQEDELWVPAPNSGATGRASALEIKAIADPDWLYQRLYYDQLRAEHVRTIYEVRSPFEARATRPGTLVGIVTDLLDDRTHSARIVEALDAQTFRVDMAFPPESVPNLADPSMTFADLIECGEQSVAQFLTPTGSELHPIIDAETAADGRSMTIVIASALDLGAMPLSSMAGSAFAVGTASNRIRRCEVVEQVPGKEFSMSLNCTDVGDGIYREMRSRFNWAA